jgi:hypothetical protein
MDQPYIRRVVPMVRVSESPPQTSPVGSIAGRLEDWVVPPGWEDLSEDDERYPGYSDWTVQW